jgi:hypothetical protein
MRRGFRRVRRDPCARLRGFACGLVATVVVGACGSAPAMAPGTASVVSAPVRVAHTRLGPVGYRAVGTGPPLVLIMGYAWTIEDWDPGWCTPWHGITGW